MFICGEKLILFKPTPGKKKSRSGVGFSFFLDFLLSVRANHHFRTFFGKAMKSKLLTASAIKITREGSEKTKFLEFTVTM